VNQKRVQKNREVAQAGSAPGLGPGGRRFESCLPDHLESSAAMLGFFLCLLVSKIKDWGDIYSYQKLSLQQKSNFIVLLLKMY
jgi:hypothetical protein